MQMCDKCFQLRRKNVNVFVRTQKRTKTDKMYTVYFSHKTKTKTKIKIEVNERYSNKTLCPSKKILRKEIQGYIPLETP